MDERLKKPGCSCVSDEEEKIMKNESKIESLKTMRGLEREKLKEAGMLLLSSRTSVIEDRKHKNSSRAFLKKETRKMLASY